MFIWIVYVVTSASVSNVLLFYFYFDMYEKIEKVRASWVEHKPQIPQKRKKKLKNNNNNKYTHTYNILYIIYANIIILYNMSVWCVWNMENIILKRKTHTIYYKFNGYTTMYTYDM